MSKGHGSEAWRKLAARRVAIGRANDEPCAKCGKPIDYSLSGRERWGPTADHMVPLAHGGDLLPALEELRPMHRACNSKGGALITSRARKAGRPAPKAGSSAPKPVSSGGTTTPYPRYSGITLRRGSLPLLPPEDMVLLAGCSGGMPRFFTGTHPKAVRSLFDADAEAFVRDQMGIALRPWQRAVLTRGLEVDADGRLCHRVVVVSVGRQSGKTWLIRALTSLRQRLFAHEEPQSILHLARVRDAARSVMINEAFVRWAKARGIVVRASNGQEQWRWPDNATWDLSSLSGVFGRSAALVLCDEVWDITRQQYFEGVQPVTAARPNAQTWFFSAAHRESTELTPLMIERAIEGREGYALFDWGALPGDDLNDPAVWRRMGPHWDEARELAVRDAAGEEAFAEQWANIWPDVLGRAINASPFPNWGTLRKAPTDEPPFGALVAMDEHYDASGAVVAALHDNALWVREVANLSAAVALAKQWTDGEVLAGISLRHVLTSHGLGHAIPYGAKETALGLPRLDEAIKAGRLAHEHSELMNMQASGVRIKTSDAGVKSLSIKDSKCNVTGIKLAAWLLWHEHSRERVEAAIW